jgi:hypothetical protein
MIPDVILRIVLSINLAVILNSCEQKTNPIETNKIEFVVDSLVHNSPTSLAYYIYGSLHNNTNDSLFYFECDHILNCGVGKFRRLGEWSVRFNGYTDFDTMLLLPYSSRSAIFFFSDVEPDIICKTDSVLIDLSYHNSSNNAHSPGVELLKLNINQYPIKVGEIP